MPEQEHTVLVVHVLGCGPKVVTRCSDELEEVAEVRDHLKERCTRVGVQLGCLPNGTDVPDFRHSYSS